MFNFAQISFNFTCWSELVQWCVIMGKITPEIGKQRLELRFFFPAADLQDQCLQMICVDGGLRLSPCFFFRWKPTQMGETTNQKSTNRRRIAPVYPPENSHIPPKILLTMIFLLSRWDMLVRWRVSIFASKTIRNRRWVIYYWRLPCRSFLEDSPSQSLL